MRKLIYMLAGAAALASASTANAASVITGPTPSTLTPPGSALFGANVTGSTTTSTAINDTFTFTIAGGPALTDAQVSTILLGGSQNINFSSIKLDNLYSFVKTSIDDSPETWALLPAVTLGNGTHTINVLGSLLGPTGSYSGTINVQAAVPEAKTWMMMLLGFGAMGLAIRRRRQPVLAQVA
jgi:PEP-CTERM motif